MKKKIILAAVVGLFLMGCGETDVTGTRVVSKDAPAGESSLMKDSGKENDHEEKVYHVGEKAVFDEKYTLTFISIKETDERNEYSEEDVAQVVEVIYMFENLTLDKDLYISDMDFNFVDEKGNMINSYPLEEKYTAAETPKGVKALGSFFLGTKEESDKISAHFEENWFSTKAKAKFNLEINEEVDVNLEGTLPDFDKSYKIGEIIEVSTSKGDYTLSIDGVRKVENRNEFSNKTPGDVYLIDYTYSNINLSEPLFISEFEFSLIDEQGTMGFMYPGEVENYPLETVKGARCQAQIVLASHSSSQQIILCYRDNFFSYQADFYIDIDHILE